MNQPVTCLGCGMELEAEGYTPEPLCAHCKQDNYLVFDHDEAQFYLFANSGQPHKPIMNLVSIAKYRRAKRRRKAA